MKILVTGAAGMLGRAVTEAWRKRGGDAEFIGIARADVDLRKQARSQTLSNGLRRT